MKKKNEISYDKVFSLIKEKESNIKVSWIIVDFELALVNSCIKNFKNARVRRCWFHFDQILFRKVSDLGCKKIFKESPSFRTHCFLISALAFVPPEKTLEEFDNLLFYFEHLQNINEKIFIFAEWFKSNYISNGVGKNHSTVFWSTYDLALANLPFTNNSLEAYNRHLNNFSETTHPSLYSLLSELKKETELSFIEIEIATFKEIRQYGSN